MSKTENILRKALPYFAVSIAVLFVLGTFSLIYLTYRVSRVPIYHTVMTDFEFVQQEGQTGARSEMQHELQRFIDKYEVKTLDCFLFQGHTNRPIYCILMVGDIPADADFSEYAPEKFPLKSDPWLFSTLKLCGAEPQKSDACLNLKYYLFYFQVFIYRNHIILEIVTENPKYLRDEEKQAFLEQHIAPRKKHERESTESE